MTGRNDFRITPPQQVYDSYKEIRDSELIRNKILTDKNITEFQLSLNKSQPSSEEESKTRSLIQYMYRKNPTNFCRFLVRSKLSHLILWTEAKCIVRHFGLIGIVYVKWNDNMYECSLHKNADINLQENSKEHPSAQQTYKQVDENRKYQDNNNNRPDHRYQRNDIRGNYRNRYNQRDNYRGGHGRQYNYIQERTKYRTNSEDNFPILPISNYRAESITCDDEAQTVELAFGDDVEKPSYSKAVQTDAIESKEDNDSFVLNI